MVLQEIVYCTIDVILTIRLIDVESLIIVVYYFKNDRSYVGISKLVMIYGNIGIQTVTIESIVITLVVIGLFGCGSTLSFSGKIVFWN